MLSPWMNDDVARVNAFERVRAKYFVRLCEGGLIEYFISHHIDNKNGEQPTTTTPHNRLSNQPPPIRVQEWIQATKQQMRMHQ